MQSFTYRFPLSRPVICQHWIVQVRREKWKPNRRTLICADHFDNKCFDKTGQVVRLKPDAVPTIFSYPERLKKVFLRIMPYEMQSYLKDWFIGKSSSTCTKTENCAWTIRIIVRFRSCARISHGNTDRYCNCHNKSSAPWSQLLLANYTKTTNQNQTNQTKSPKFNEKTGLSKAVK